MAGDAVGFEQEGAAEHALCDRLDWQAKRAHHETPAVVHQIGAAPVCGCWLLELADQVGPMASGPARAVRNRGG